MKFEFVDFYPRIDRTKKQDIGSCHIYFIDIGMDIRGIKVFRKSKKIFFYMPTCQSIDADTKEPVRFPVLSWTNPDTKKELIDFLHKEVAPVIKNRLNKKKVKGKK